MKATPTKCVAAYVRVSTMGQNEAGQRAEIERWLKGNGIAARNVHWFVDKGRGGDNLSRPALERLKAAIFAGDVGTVLGSCPS
jgi:DNA invertase Pin-like site-specific DNA recombinase